MHGKTLQQGNISVGLKKLRIAPTNQQNSNVFDRLGGVSGKHANRVC
jgi:hypothetical protein